MANFQFPREMHFIPTRRAKAPGPRNVCDLMLWTAQLSELSSKMVFSHTCRRALTQALFDNPWNGICSFKILEGETRRKRGTCPARPYRDHSSSHTSIGQVIGGDHGTASPPDATRSSSLRPRDAPPCRCSIFAGQATVSPNILAAYS